MATRYAAINALASAGTTILTSQATGTALKTMLQLVTSATTPVTIIEWGISFDGTNAASAPVQVRLQRQTSAGTPGITNTGQINKFGSAAGSPTANTTSGLAPTGTWSAEPTASDIIAGPYLVNPTSGLVIQYPLGREPLMDVSTRLAIVTVSSATVNAQPYVIFEE